MREMISKGYSHWGFRQSSASFECRRRGLTSISPGWRRGVTYWQGGDWIGHGMNTLPIIYRRWTIRATLYSIVEFDLKFLPVPVTAYSQTSTLRSR
jgi:hypothetical protein